MSDEGLRRLLLPLTSLTTLDIKNCGAVTDDGLHTIAKLTALTSLCLRLPRNFLPLIYTQCENQPHEGRRYIPSVRTNRRRGGGGIYPA